MKKQIRFEYDKNIGVVTSPFVVKAGIAPLSNLVDIFSELNDKVFLYTGCEGLTAVKHNNTNVIIS
jgi:hypothetical protein